VHNINNLQKINNRAVIDGVLISADNSALLLLNISLHGHPACNIFGIFKRVFFLVGNISKYQYIDIFSLKKILSSRYFLGKTRRF